MALPWILSWLFGQGGAWKGPYRVDAADVFVSGAVAADSD
jgi:hypothetical protein